MGSAKQNAARQKFLAMIAKKKGAKKGSMPMKGKMNKKMNKAHGKMGK